MCTENNKKIQLNVRNCLATFIFEMLNNYIFITQPILGNTIIVILSLATRSIVSPSSATQSSDSNHPLQKVAMSSPSLIRVCLPGFRCCCVGPWRQFPQTPA